MIIKKKKISRTQLFFVRFVTRSLSVLLASEIVLRDHFVPEVIVVRQSELERVPPLMYREARKRTSSSARSPGLASRSSGSRSSGSSPAPARRAPAPPQSIFRASELKCSSGYPSHVEHAPLVRHMEEVQVRSLELLIPLANDSLALLMSLLQNEEPSQRHRIVLCEVQERISILEDEREEASCVEAGFLVQR